MIFVIFTDVHSLHDFTNARFVYIDTIQRFILQLNEKLSVSMLHQVKYDYNKTFPDPSGKPDSLTLAWDTMQIRVSRLKKYLQYPVMYTHYMLQQRYNIIVIFDTLVGEQRRFKR